MISFAEVSKIVGTEQEIKVGYLTIKVKVLDYKEAYGKDRWLVTPVSGEGVTWVEADFIKKGK